MRRNQKLKRKWEAEENEKIEKERTNTNRKKKKNKEDLIKEKLSTVKKNEANGGNFHQNKRWNRKMTNERRT